MRVQDNIAPTRMSGMLARFSMKALCEQAELILEGNVLKSIPSAGSVQIGSGFNLVFTDRDLQVTSILKKPPYNIGSGVKLRTMGGSFQDVSMTISGEASFSDDEHVIVFLTRDFPESLPVDVFTVLGGYQGKFVVTGSGSNAQVSRIDTEQRSYLDNFQREINGYLGTGGFFSSNSASG